MGIEAGCGSMEGEYSWSRGRDIRHAIENMASPETRAAIIEEIACLLAWLIEVGPGADPVLVKQRRAQLHASLAQIGIDLNKPHWSFLYADQIMRIAWEREHPVKPQQYPSFVDFAAKVKNLLKTSPSLFDDLRGRDGKELAEYLYGLGFIMASKLAYPYVFPDTDPITINQHTNEVEGRHRYLTLVILNTLGFDTRQWYWVRVHVDHAR